MPFDFPDNPVAGDEFVSGGATYTYTAQGVWDLGSSAVATDYVLKAGDTMTGALKVESTGTGGDIWLTPGNAAGLQAGMIEWHSPTVRLSYLGWGAADHLAWRFENGCTGVRLSGGGIQMGSDSAVNSSLDFSKGVCLYGYGGPSQFGWTITSGTLNHVVQNIGNRHIFRVGPDDANNTRVIIDQNGIGPRSSHNVVWLNGFGGTMDFRVNPSMVSMRLEGVKRTGNALGGNTATKMCAYPAGVPAPWGTLRAFGMIHNSSGFTPQSNGWYWLEARPDGVYLLLWGGSQMNASDHQVSGTITWSR